MLQEHEQTGQGNAAKKFYSLKAVRTPLPSQSPAQQNDDEPSKREDPQIRAENEDDDGYDPFSDRVEQAPFFEQDPWS